MDDIPVLRAMMLAGMFTWRNQCTLVAFIMVRSFVWCQFCNQLCISLMFQVVFRLHGKGKSVPAFQLRSDTPSALNVISESSHIDMDIIKDPPDSESAWTLPPPTDASGCHFQAFLLEKSKSWAPTTIVQGQNMLTKRYCAAATVIISCGFKEGEIRSAVNIKKMSKEQFAQREIRRKESTQRGMDIKVLWKHGGQVSQHEVFQAATLQSSRKASVISQLEIKRNSDRMIKTIEHFNLQKSAEKQHPLKTASSGCDGDWFYVVRQLLLVSKEKKQSTNKPRSEIKASRGDNGEDFNGKIIRKQADFQHPDGERETEPDILLSALKSDNNNNNNDVDHKLTEAEVLIVFLLPDAERKTQTEPSSGENRILNTGWKTVEIKDLDDPPSATEVIKENFMIEPECLKGSLFSLEMYEFDRTERIDIKAAESAATVSTEKQTKDTEGNIGHTETPHERMATNPTKQSEEPVIPSPPPLNMTERVTAEPMETVTANTEITQTTSSTEVFTQGSTQKSDILPRSETRRTTTSPETHTQPRFIKCMTRSMQVTSVKSFSGLRMREDFLADINKLHDSSGADVTANRPEPEDVQKPLQTIHKQPADTIPKVSEVALLDFYQGKLY